LSDNGTSKSRTTSRTNFIRLLCQEGLAELRRQFIEAP